MICFTICSRNFIAQAYVLYRSLTRNHPEATFCVALCDEVGELDELSFPFRIITIDELAIRNFPQMCERYNITELNTAIKPFVFHLLHFEAPGEAVVYLDPDILIVSRMQELEDAIAAGADCVLTPHMLEPCEWAELHEGRLLEYGAYNLGFVMLRGTPDAERINHWWARRLETDCLIDRSRGLFVDQKWADLFPSFIAKTHILRHPGYNVAYWNLATRSVRRDSDGTWRVNGEPLRFFHFSGSSLSGDPIFSRHSSEFLRGSLRDLDSLFSQYVEEVLGAGYAHYRAVYPYAFNWNGASGTNEHTPQDMAKIGPPTNFSGTILDEVRPHLPLLTAQTNDEYVAKIGVVRPITDARRIVEDFMVPHEQDPFAFEGYCIVCGRVSEFAVSSMYSSGTYPDDRPRPNWREHAACPGCSFVNRLRGALHVLFQEVAPQRSDRIYLTEQSTPLFRWFDTHFENVTGSEYLGADVPAGVTVGGLRNEDVQALSFDDGAFDLVISFEVMEHVPFPQRGFKELRRVLADGGTLFLTVPFSYEHKDDLVRARLEPDGTITHLEPPEYHGNPIDPENGALCFRYFGWDITHMLQEAGFTDVSLHFYWSRRLGYLGPTNSVIVARA